MQHTHTNTLPIKPQDRSKSYQSSLAGCEWFKAAVVLAERPFGSIVKTRQLSQASCQPGIHTLYLTQNPVFELATHTHTQKDTSDYGLALNFVQDCRLQHSVHNRTINKIPSMEKILKRWVSHLLCRVFDRFAAQIVIFQFMKLISTDSVSPHWII